MSGSKPLFFADTITWKAYLINSQRAPKITPVHSVCENPDIRLVNVWLDLREFTMAVNLAHQTQREISSDLFQEALISVQYRLLHLSYNAHDNHETLRAAMLAFSSIVLFETPDLTEPRRHLVINLQRILQSIQGDTDTKWLKITLWLVFIYRASGLGSPDDSWLDDLWLKTTLSLGLTTWTETRELIKGFLWLDAVHDEAGKLYFNRRHGCQNVQKAETRVGHSVQGPRSCRYIFIDS